MKDNFKILERYLLWLFLLLFLDIVFALILWIADLDAFYALTIVIFFGTLLFFGISEGFFFFQESSVDK